MKKILLLLSLYFVSLNLSAQKINEKYQYHINKATSEIRIDGKLDEAQWQRCETTTDFWMITPADTSRARLKTEARFTYDDKYLYFGRLTLSKCPDLFSYDTIYSEVVSTKFDKIKPKSIYFKLAMTPFAIAFDAALCGGFSTGSIASDPAAVVSILNAVSK